MHVQRAACRHIIGLTCVFQLHAREAWQRKHRHIDISTVCVYKHSASGSALTGQAIFSIHTSVAMDIRSNMQAMAFCSPETAECCCLLQPARLDLD